MNSKKKSPFLPAKNDRISPNHISSAWIARAIVHILKSKQSLDIDLTFHIQGQVLRYLTELWTTYLCRLASVCSGIASGSGRSKVQFNDLIYVFASCSVSSTDLRHASYTPTTNEYDSARLSNQVQNKNILDSLGEYIPILSPTFGFHVKQVPASCLSRIAPPHTFHPLFPVVLSQAEFPSDIIASLQTYTGSNRYKSSTHSNPIIEVHVPRLTLPSHVPSQCPKFPPPHTYRRTSSIMPLHATQASRAFLVSTERSIMATNIQKFLAKSSALSDTDSFKALCENTVWLSSCTEWICASAPTNWWVQKSPCDAAGPASLVSADPCETGPCEIPAGPCESPAGPCKTPAGPCETPAGPCETPASPCETPVGLFLNCESSTGPCDMPNSIPITTATESNACAIPDDISVCVAATDKQQSPSGNQSVMDAMDVFQVDHTQPSVVPNLPMESIEPVSPLGGLKIRFRVGSK